MARKETKKSGNSSNRKSAKTALKKSITRSMTGFGQATVAGEGSAITIEIRSLNNRFLDLHVDLPSELGHREIELRKALQANLERGRIDVKVRLKRSGDAVYRYDIDRGLVRIYQQAFREISKEFGIKGQEEGQFLINELLRRPDIIRISPLPQRLDAEEKLFQKALNAALMMLQTMRSAEGARLQADLLNRLDILQKIVKVVKARVIERPQQVRERLRERLRRLEEEFAVSPERLNQEVAIAVDKLDISEELTRFASHIEEFRQAFSTAPQGRKMDFLLQELLRECNTTASKGQDAVIQQQMVLAKSELEKMREQVQNIE